MWWEGVAGPVLVSLLAAAPALLRRQGLANLKGGKMELLDSEPNCFTFPVCTNNILGQTLKQLKVDFLKK